jgi:ParB family transcriptional regulator, chromosome partitioning protein
MCTAHQAGGPDSTRGRGVPERHNCHRPRLLIAKLPDSQQQEAFNAAFRGMWTSDGNSQVLIPVRELAAWIESNILLQLASAPFDKQDEALVPEAGSCSNCPKRTGFNKLLFADVRKDSCT